jgi:tetratricopeptide (TPR) repeat protein
MVPGNRLTWLLLLVISSALAVATAQDRGSLERDFQTALTQYNAGQFAEAAARLEKLSRDLPASFEVHELLGLAYSAQSQDAKASEHLEKAVRLKPDSAAARTNFAASLARQGKFAPAEEQLRSAVKLEPRNYDANHNLGELYVRARRIAGAVPFLEQAQRINPASYDNGYDLSLAYLHMGRTVAARKLIRDLLAQKDTAELHNLLGQIEEKSGNFVVAAKEFETAAHLEPSEGNLFDWGSELLLHRTLDPAIEVFKQGTQRYPASPRMAIGLGIAFYSRGNYDDAVKSLLRAADLNPSDQNCYLFLSRAYDSAPSQANEVIERFRRFAELQPKNARAPYYYAMSLWKGKRAQDADVDLRQIEALLQTAITLDPKFAEARLQLGNLYSDQKRYADAIPQYVGALKENPDLGDAHYRLGQAYVRTGDKQRAQEHFEIYQRVRAQHLAEIDKQRAEVRQFVYTAKNVPSAKE